MCKQLLPHTLHRTIGRFIPIYPSHVHSIPQPLGLPTSTSTIVCPYHRAPCGWLQHKWNILIWYTNKINYYNPEDFTVQRAQSNFPIEQLTCQTFIELSRAQLRDELAAGAGGERCSRLYVQSNSAGFCCCCCCCSEIILLQAIITSSPPVNNYSALQLQR